MSEPRQRVEADLQAARKAGERDKVATLGLLLSAIDNERIRAGEAVDEPRFLALVQKAIKQRKEASEQYRQGNREELASREEREAEILAAYLPEAADEGELRRAIAALIAEEELAGPAALGVIMPRMMARFRGRADGATINRLARELLEL